jgi:hypothetical protein
MAKRGPRIIEDDVDSETLRVRAQDRARQLRARAKKAEQTQLNAQQLQISARIGVTYGSLEHDDPPTTDTSLGLRAYVDPENPLPAAAHALPTTSPPQSPLISTTILEPFNSNEYVPFRNLNRESNKSLPPSSPPHSTPEELKEEKDQEEEVNQLSRDPYLAYSVDMNTLQTRVPASEDLNTLQHAFPPVAESFVFNHHDESSHLSDTDTAFFNEIGPSLTPVPPTVTLSSEDLILDSEQVILDKVDITTSPILSPTLAAHSESSDSEESTTSKEDNTEERSPLQYGIDKVYDSLYRTFHGCTRREHTKVYAAHITSTNNPTNHHSLNQIHEKPLFTSVLDKHDYEQNPAFTLYSEFGRQAFPTTDDWQATFEGTQPQNPEGPPIQLCLHQDHVPDNATDSAVQGFDVDSFLGFATSLAVARQGINVYPAPFFIRNIKTDIHVEATHVQDNTSNSIMLKEIPHFLFGDIVGFAGVQLYILFPHLPRNPNKDHFSRLTNEQLQRFIDHVLLPAAYHATPSDYHQHLPPSFRVAYANSRASQTESRTTSTAHYLGQQSIHHHLQAQYLDDITTCMQRTVQRTPGLRDFRDFMLFFTQKNSKLVFKRSTPLESMRAFNQTFQYICDPAYIIRDRCWIDIAKEICPKASHLSTDRDIINDDAQVYLFRKCCAMKYLRHLYDGEIPKSAARLFQTAMLEDAVGLTNRIPKNSRLYRAGLIYDQVYTSWKLSLDATKTYPFQNEVLESMAIDRTILRGAQTAGYGGRRGPMDRVVEHAYLSSKERLRISMLDARGKSFGWRHEQRCALPLYEGLHLQLEQDELLCMAPPPVSVPQPTCIWAVKTSTFLPFVTRQVNKYATGFEFLRARCSTGFITWEQTKMMAMFLRCLRFTVGGHQLSRESALWKESAESTTGTPATTQTWRGLGFQTSLATSGYCWIQPGLIDWTHLCFRTEVTEHILFGNQAMKFAYLKKGGQARDFFHSSMKTELALGWLRHYEDNRMIRDRMLQWLGHLCLQQLRADLFPLLQKEVHEEFWPALRSGDYPLTYKYLGRAYKRGYAVTAGNRSHHKDVKALLKYIWGFDDQWIRKWPPKPFRAMFERICLMLREHHPKTSLEVTFRHRFWYLNVQYHWIVPNLTPAQFMPKAGVDGTGKHSRLWIGLRKKGGRPPPPHPDPYNVDQWEWAKRLAVPHSQPDPEYPGYLSWERAQWEAWIKSRLHTAPFTAALSNTDEDGVPDYASDIEPELKLGIGAELFDKPTVLPTRRSSRLQGAEPKAYTQVNDTIKEESEEEEEGCIARRRALVNAVPEDRVVIWIP